MTKLNSRISQIDVTDRVKLYDFRHKFALPEVTQKDLTLETLEMAVLTASDDPALPNGIYDRDGNIFDDFVDPSKIARGQVPPAHLPEERRVAAETKKGTHVYLGTLHGHFGHFLVESLSRSWALSELPSDTFVVFHVHARPRATWDNRPAYTRFMLSALGITPDRLVFADKDMVFERLIVPTNLCVLRSSAHARLTDVYDLIGKDQPASSLKKIYLTRTAYSERNNRARSRNVANERELEALFKARGYTVVSPETLPIQEQISLFKGASHLAGTNGSALHMSMFCRPETELLVVAWRVNQTQLMLDVVRGVRSRHVNVFGGWDPEDRPIVDIAKVAEYLQ